MGFKMTGLQGNGCINHSASDRIFLKKESPQEAPAVLFSKKQDPNTNMVFVLSGKKQEMNQTAFFVLFFGVFSIFFVFFFRVKEKQRDAHPPRNSRPALGRLPTPCPAGAGRGLRGAAGAAAAGGGDPRRPPGRWPHPARGEGQFLKPIFFKTSLGNGHFFLKPAATLVERNRHRRCEDSIWPWVKTQIVPPSEGPIQSKH